MDSNIRTPYDDSKLWRTSTAFPLQSVVSSDNYKLYWEQLRRILSGQDAALVYGAQANILQLMDDLEGRTK